MGISISAEEAQKIATDESTWQVAQDCAVITQHIEAAATRGAFQTSVALSVNANIDAIKTSLEDKGFQVSIRQGWDIVVFIISWTRVKETYPTNEGVDDEI